MVECALALPDEFSDSLSASSLLADIMSLVEVLGYAASAAVLATFCMSTMIPLRMLALGSNVLFIAYGYVDHLYPVFMLHAILFPVNALRLVQFQRIAQSRVRNALDGRAPIFLTAKMTVHEAALILSDHNIGASCVLAGDRLIGIFSERDILRKVVAAGRDPGAMRVAEAMTPDPCTVSPETSLVDALFSNDRWSLSPSTRWSTVTVM